MLLGYLIILLQITFTLDELMLKNFGGVERNKLDNVLNLNIYDNNDSDNIGHLKLRTSSYHSHDDLINTLSDKKGSFCILSLNCQSLNAKFYSLLILIDELKQNNIKLGAICLQETWLVEDADMTLFQIPDYNCITQGKYCSAHGGLAIYLHHDYLYEKIILPEKSEIWEGLIVKIINKNGKNILICNIYRPPGVNLNNEFTQIFNDEINILMTELNRHRSYISLIGDFNIDLLKINERIVYRDFLDNIISSGLHPLITFPTRIAEHSATLIDNVFTNYPMTDSDLTGILVSEISDHFPYFYTMKLDVQDRQQSSSLIYTRKFTPESLDKLYNEIDSLDIYHNFNNDLDTDPNINYNILEQILVNGLNKHIPLKKSKLVNINTRNRIGLQME
jgi:hypothetical protein